MRPQLHQAVPASRNEPLKQPLLARSRYAFAKTLLALSLTAYFPVTSSTNQGQKYSIPVRVEREFPDAACWILNLWQKAFLRPHAQHSGSPQIYRKVPLL